MINQKVLIVKLGYIETIGNESGIDNISLGDIIRTTIILHLFKNDRVTWLVTEEGLPLLAGNPYIGRIFIYNLTTILQLQSERFDVVVNLEKMPGICAFTDRVTAWRRYGFRFDAERGTAQAYERAYEALANSVDPELRKKTNKHWVEILFEMLGAKYNGENYILGYKPKTEEKYDVGFNIKVGRKWPDKAWSLENWKKLEEIIGNRHSISWQESLDNIYGYIDWINSCRLLVTNDSLGLHLAIALKKKIVALFGPTSQKEITFFGLGIALKPPLNLDCIPCFMPKCKYPDLCIDAITPEMVYKAINSLL